MYVLWLIAWYKRGSEETGYLDTVPGPLAEFKTVIELKKTKLSCYD